ncbi:MAG: hypothetical protein V1647_04500 [Pseudomonadota bacterium]
MKTTDLFKGIFVLALALMMNGCTGSQSASSFPDISNIAENISPMLTSNVSSLSVTYNDSAAWTSANAYGALKDVLGSPDEDPKVITKMFILINNLQSTIETVNSSHIDSSGAFVSCTVIPAGTTIKTPWFTDNSQTPFFTIDETDVYQCYYQEGDGLTLFGRRSNTTSGCENTYTYNIMQGTHSHNTNTEEVATRGSYSDIYTVQKAEYNSCTKDLKLAYAHRTKYETTVAFDSRSELTGNETTHEFSMRMIKVDTDQNDNTSYFTSRARGKSQTASGTDNFIISYKTSTGTDNSFCIGVNTTKYSYSVAASSASCAAYETAFEAITDFTGLTQVPTSAFDVNAASFGL